MMDDKITVVKLMKDDYSQTLVLKSVMSNLHNNSPRKNYQYLLLPNSNLLFAIVDMAEIFFNLQYY